MRYWDSSGLPQGAGARALCDIGIPWDCPKALPLGPCAMLGFLGTSPKRWRWGGRAMLGLVGTAGKRWRWSPVRLWDSLGLVGTRWVSRDVHSSYVFLHCFAHLGLAGAGAFIILTDRILQLVRFGWTSFLAYSVPPARSASTSLSLSLGRACVAPLSLSLSLPLECGCPARPRPFAVRCPCICGLEGGWVVVERGFGCGCV